MSETSRDETAFSLNPETGAPAHGLAVLDSANEAMRQLGEGDLDEAGFNAAVAPLTARPASADEPNQSTSGDETPPTEPAPESTGTAAGSPTTEE